MEMYETADGSVVINETDVKMEQALVAVQQSWPELASLTNWMRNVNPPARKGSLLHRDKYTPKTKFMQEIAVARTAALDDDIVSGAIDLTEGLAFSRLKFKVEDKDQEDVWNQIAADIDLDSKFRQWWRELSSVSQVYTAMFWGQKNYTVRGTTSSGTRRKKSFRVIVPTGLSIMDPTKVVPVGSLWFGKEDLAYVAEREEAEFIRKVLNGVEEDPVISQLMVRPYTPNPEEKAELSEAGVSTDHLFLLSKQHVWRHTLTKPEYQRFADVRLRSLFELLDLKHQLRAMDRVSLIGGTNFLIVVTKGSDQLPAQASELQSLSNQMRTLAKAPVLVGDHRLDVKIVTPPQDGVLKPEKHNALDARIASRALRIAFLGNFQSGTKADDSIKIAKVMARQLESTRHMLRRTFESKFIKPVFEINSNLTDMPKLRFFPKRVALDFDPILAQIVSDLHARGDLSRETTLSEYDFSQEEEASLREQEREEFDDIFQSGEPFNSPGNEPFNPQREGRQGGGNRNGGGTNPQSQVPPEERS